MQSWKLPYFQNLVMEKTNLLRVFVIVTQIPFFLLKLSTGISSSWTVSLSSMIGPINYQLKQKCHYTDHRDHLPAPHPPQKGTICSQNPPVGSNEARQGTSRPHRTLLFRIIQYCHTHGVYLQTTTETPLSNCSENFENVGNDLLFFLILHI